MIAAFDVSPDLIRQAFDVVLDVGLKSFVLCAAALLLDRALGRRVLARSTILYACLLGLALLPVAALAFPEMRLNLGYEREVGGLSRFAPRNGVLSQSERRHTDAHQAEPKAPQTSVTNTEPPGPTLASPHERQTTKAPASARRPFGWPAVALSVYAVVVVGALLRLSLSLAAVARLKRSCAPLLQRAWNERLAHWQAQLGVAASVQLFSTDRVDVPVMVGWRRPAILTPERLAAADARTIDAVLLHELAHVRRGDYVWNLLLRFLQAVYWPNPLLWLVSGAIGRVREQACDEVCVHWLGGPEDYRATLVELAAALLRRPLATLGMAMAGSPRLQRRLEQIDASRGRAECQARWVWRFAAIIVVATAAGALGALRVASSAAAAGETQKPAVQGEKSQEDALAAPSNQEPPAPAKRADEPKENKTEKPAVTVGAKGADDGSGGGMPQAVPIKVQVAKVRREDFIVQTTQPGTLKASRSAELYARVAGLIVAQRANVGDVVKAGDVLAEIDAPELDAELERAQTLAEEAPAAVEQAQGRLAEVLAGLEAAKAGVAKSEADVKQSTARWEFAKKVERIYLESNRKVPGSTPSSELDEKANEVEAAAGAAEAAQADLAAARAGIKQAEAAVAVAKAGLRIAQLHLTAAQQTLKRVEQRAAFRQITAPVDGVVVRQSAEPGALAQLGGQPLFVISGTHVVTMQTQVPERDALRVAPGQLARVQLDADPGRKPHEAKVSRVGYALDPKTRTMSVELDLPNADGRLRPGMYGNVTIDLETHPGALTLGRTGVYWEISPDGQSRSYCFRVVDGRAVKTDVVPGETNRMRQEIKSGLNEGDLVIAWSKESLEDAARVEIARILDDDK